MRVEDALKDSLKKLNTDYVDLYLMHWPQTETFVDCYLQMEDVYKKGLARAIGVCNFNKHHIEELMEHATIVPTVNQFEIHPLFNQRELVNYCFEMGIQPMAYTPLGRMHDALIKSKVLREIALKYNKSVPQIIVRWNIQNNICVIPKTTKLKRVFEYLDCFEFELTEEEMLAIDGMNENVRLRYNPDTVDFSIC
jgi:diketogulonate reductase-like aldo/keto reductase